MKAERCPTCRRLMKRSTQSNARYWALLHEISEHVKPGGQTYGAETWHCWAKSKWLGVDEFKLPSGRTLLIPKSSADLDTAEFCDYMTKLEAWAAEHDVYLQDLAA